MKHTVSAMIMLATAWAAYAGDMSNSIEYTQLYLVGDAFSTGWDLGSSPRMACIADGVFEWTGEIAGGKDFKFMNSREAWHKHVVNASGEPTLQNGALYKLSFYADWALPADKDLKFRVPRSGRYVVTVDLTSMLMTISDAPGEHEWPDRFFLCGSAAGREPVEVKECHGVEYKTVATLQHGKLYISDGDGHSYVPRFPDVDFSYGQNNYAMLYPSDGSEAEGWSVGVGGDYSVYIDRDTHTYMARPLRRYPVLYLVGGCCEKAWNYWDDSDCRFLPDPSDPDLMVWQGELRAGADKSDRTPPEPDKFKILTAQDWFRDTFHPYQADAPAIGTSDARISGGDDLKWTIQTDGIYRLTLDLRNETLTGTLIEACDTTSAGETEDSDIAGVTDATAGNMPEQYFNLQGMRIDRPSGSVYIKVHDGQASKIFMR